VAVDRDGFAIALWARAVSEGRDHASGVAQASIRPPGGTWSAARDLFDPAEDVFPPVPSGLVLRAAGLGWSAAFRLRERPVSVAALLGSRALRPRAAGGGWWEVPLGRLGARARVLRLETRDAAGNRGSLEVPVRAQVTAVDTGEGAGGATLTFRLASAAAVAVSVDRPGRDAAQLRALPVARLGPGAHRLVLGSLPPGRYDIRVTAVSPDGLRATVHRAMAAPA
jgi:hypothetical protein